MIKYELDSFHIGAKGLIFNRDKKILLLERNHPVKKYYWDLPGGRVQKDESLKEALIRELKEEIGLTSIQEFYHLGMFLTNIRIPIPKQEENVGLIFSIYTCHLTETFHPILSDEHTSFEWVKPFQAFSKLEEQYPKEFIEKLVDI